VAHHDDDTYKHESWISECDRQEPIQRYGKWHESLKRLFSASQVWYKWALYDRDPFPGGPGAGSRSWVTRPIRCCRISARALARRWKTAASWRWLSKPCPRTCRRVAALRTVASAARQSGGPGGAARGIDNHLVSPLAALKRDALIWLRQRISSDRGGRGLTWIPAYDAGSRSVLAM
jgi:hypothetical protein